MTNSDAIRIRLTAAQVSAVEIYVTDPALESEAFELHGNTLHVVAAPDAACLELVEASNSADLDMKGPGEALMNLCRKVRAAAKAA